MPSQNLGALTSHALRATGVISPIKFGAPVPLLDALRRHHYLVTRTSSLGLQMPVSG